MYPHTGRVARPGQRSYTYGFCEPVKTKQYTFLISGIDQICVDSLQIQKVYKIGVEEWSWYVNLLTNLLLERFALNLLLSSTFQCQGSLPLLVVI